MKNLHLSTKLTILSLILSGFLLLTGWVGGSRLSLLNRNTDELGTKVMGRLQLLSDIQTQIFILNRNQKNAVITNDDSQSLLFSNASEAAARELISLVAQFEKGATTVELKSRLQLLKSQAENLVSLNQQCLNLAKLNTNVKGRSLLVKKIMPSMERIAQQVEMSTESLSTQSASPPSNNASGTQGVLKAIRETSIALMLHMATKESDSTVTISDQSIREKVDSLVQMINVYEPSSKSIDFELKKLLTEVRRDLDEIFMLASTNSNVKSAEITISTAKESTDAILKILDEIGEESRNETKLAVKDSENIYFAGLNIIFGTSVAGLVLGIVASFLISRSITRPVSLVKELAKELATGNLVSRINLKQSDEVGELATATDSLADALTSVVGQIQKTASDLGGSSTGLDKIANSLIKQSEQTSTQASGVSTASEQLSANINTMSSAAEEMSMNFASIASATEEMSASVGSISSAAEQTSSNVAAVTTAIHDISISSEQVLGNVREGAHIASNASQMAANATATMKQLDQSSTEINKVTETIKMIALQTNLLALNATIEATSAGEAGKGFAVVAHEIKQLANQSAKAAEDIANKIEGVQLGTRQAVGVIQEIAAVIREINASADRISVSVEHQNRAAQTISQNIAQANTGVGQIARSIAEVAATANDMSRSIAEATRGATDVSRNVGEAAKAASGISDNIAQVSLAAQETNRSSESVTTASISLAQLSHELNRLASRFKLPSNGS